MPVEGPVREVKRLVDRLSLKTDLPDDKEDEPPVAALSGDGNGNNMDLRFRFLIPFNLLFVPPSKTHGRGTEFMVNDRSIAKPINISFPLPFPPDER